MSTGTESPGRATTESRLDSLTDEVVALRRALYALLELLAWAALAAPAAVLLLVVRRPEGLLWPRVFDVSHAVFSGIAALVALRLSRRLFAPVLRGAWFHYAAALALASLVGLALELAQIVGPGEPSLKDLARDALGALAALGFALSVDAAVPRLSRSPVRWALRILALVMLLRVSYPVVRLSLQVREQKKQYPTLADFESLSEQPFVSTDYGAELERVVPPSEFTTARGQHIGKVTFKGGNEHPKLEILSLSSDWSRAKALAFEVYSPSKSPVQLSLRVDAEPRDGSVPARFTTALSVPPGASTQRIPIETIRAGADGGEMNMSRMKAVLLFLWRPEETVVLGFDAVRVEY